MASRKRWTLSLSRGPVAVALFVALLVALAAVVAADPDPSTYGGPVSNDYAAEGVEKDLPLPGKEVIQRDGAALNAADALYRYVQEMESAKKQGVVADTKSDEVKVVSLDDLDRLQAEQQPPLRYSFAPDFLEVPLSVPVSLPLPVRRVELQLSGAQDGQGPVQVQGHNADGNVYKAWSLSSLLPATIVNRLPSLPSLPSLPTISLPSIPDYIPGIKVDAHLSTPSVHIPTPHIPTPSEIVRGFTQEINAHVALLEKKMNQLAELVKCSCPRPARCEGLWSEFEVVKPPQPPANSPAGPAIAPEKKHPESTSGSSPFSVGANFELTRPNGDPLPGSAYSVSVDTSGPHFNRTKPAKAPLQPPPSVVPPIGSGPSGPSATVVSASAGSSSSGPVKEASLTLSDKHIN